MQTVWLVYSIVPSGVKDYLHKALAPEFLSNWVLTLVGILGVLAAVRTLIEIREETRTSQKALVLAQRPKIIVRNFYFSEPTGIGGIVHVPKANEVGFSAVGQFYIVNSGGTPAHINEIYSTVLITLQLPMKRPYEGEQGVKQNFTLLPGESRPQLFQLPTPLDKKQANELAMDRYRLYVLGWVTYTDDLGTQRTTAFCRIYDYVNNRLVVLANPDYEHSD